MTTNISPDRKTWTERVAPITRAFHAYATWLVSLSWRRFALLSFLLVILMSVLESLPPFRWRIRDFGEHAEPLDHRAAERESESPGNALDIRIDDDGVRARTSESAHHEAAAILDDASLNLADAATPAPEKDNGVHIEVGDGHETTSIHIALPNGAVKRKLRAGIERAIEELDEVKRGDHEADDDDKEREHRTPLAGLRDEPIGDFLSSLAHLVIVASIIIKVTYRKQLTAEAHAAKAMETAEAEQLKRQVAEARIAAMQAQVEPHFLFNTLASIDHLIETDPPRASRMQKSLIALLRATVPAMREATASGTTRNLGQEVDVILPYLDLLKMRMEERLTTDVAVPAGLRSAEFPSMVLQVLVENAIRHGLEPKTEGGSLTVNAEIVDARLVVRVTDSGVGLGHAPRSAGAGTGLANVRERLQLLYGSDASLTVEASPAGGTIATLVIPYRAAQTT